MATLQRAARLALQNRSDHVRVPDAAVSKRLSAMVPYRAFPRIVPNQ